MSLFLTAALALTTADAFLLPGGVTFRLPSTPTVWVHLDDATATCSLLSQTGDDQNGVELKDAGGNATLLTHWGVAYERTVAANPWSPVAEGRWLTDGEPDMGWTRQVVRTGDTIPATHHMYWLDTTLVFANDPRFGANSYYPEDRYKKTWISVDNGASCDVLHEAARTYAEPDLQTIQLEPTAQNADAWTIGTGAATRGTQRVIGNWAPY